MPLDIDTGDASTASRSSRRCWAQTEEALITSLVLDAARTELREMDRFVNEADFRWKDPGAKREEKPAVKPAEKMA